MCRLAAYSGPPLQLDRFLLQPEHNLEMQASAPREMAEALMNADGFGFGWYREPGLPEKYINTCPIWSDVNLAGLSRSLNSHICLANVRSATPGQALSLDNTQPFMSDGVMYLHNGLIKDFGENVRARFHAHLEPVIQAQIRGNTDSEYLFALLRQELRQHDGDLERALPALLQTLPALLDGATALVNLVVSDGRILLACRQAFNNGRCPSLYYTAAHPDFPGATLIASERLSVPEAWEPVAENSLLLVTPQQEVRRPAA